MASFNDIFDEPSRFDFYHTLRRLEKWNSTKPKIGHSATRRDEYLALGQDPFLIFPDANISKAERKADGRIALFVRFMGLLGPQGAMPLATTEEAYGYLLHNDDAFARFLDLINNRFMQLFFRAWANSRAIVQRDRPGEDRFECYVGSGIGLGLATLRDIDTVPDMVKVGYAGLMGPATKSVSRLRDLVMGIFGLRVEIEEFVGSRLLFDLDQRSRLGQGFMTLSHDLLLGDGVYSVQDKIRIRIFATTIAEYRELLPSGKRARKLADLVFFYIGAEIEWDVELALPVGEVQPVRLGVAGQLGWTTWMAPNWNAEKGALRTDARFDLTKRFQAN